MSSVNNAPENPVVADFLRRGFIKVKNPGVPKNFFDKAVAEIANFPQPVSIGHPGFESVSYALLDDTITAEAADFQLTPVLIGAFDHGFMNFSMHAHFMRDYTDIHKYVDSIRATTKESREWRLHRLVPAEYTGKGRYAVERSEGMVAGKVADPIAIFEANRLLNYMDDINELTVALAEVVDRLHYIKYLNFGTLSRGTVLTAISYSGDATTFSDDPTDPVHTDPMSKRLAGIINLTGKPRKAILGRTKETREVVWQMPGEIIFLDNEGTSDRPSPIHHFDEGISMIFIVDGKYKRDFIRDEMSTFEKRGLWKPSTPNLWVAGAQYSPPSTDLIHRGINAVSDALHQASSRLPLGISAPRR